MELRFEVNLDVPVQSPESVRAYIEESLRRLFAHPSIPKDQRITVQSVLLDEAE